MFFQEILQNLSIYLGVIIQILEFKSFYNFRYAQILPLSSFRLFNDNNGEVIEYKDTKIGVTKNRILKNRYFDMNLQRSV